MGVTTSTIIKSKDNIEPYELGNFISNEVNQTEQMKSVASLSDKNVIDQVNENIDLILNQIKSLEGSISTVNNKVDIIEREGVKGRDLDQQVIEALKDLKNYSTFFEQAAFQMETKILKTSLSIAQKIIGIEVGENSALIAKQTIENLMGKLQTASKVNIHLHPKDYLVLKEQLSFGEMVNLQEDPNVTQGGVVIASDMGNFDGNIDVKVKTMLESLDAVV